MIPGRTGQAGLGQCLHPDVGWGTSPSRFYQYLTEAMTQEMGSADRASSGLSASTSHTLELVTSTAGWPLCLRVPTQAPRPLSPSPPAWPSRTMSRPLGAKWASLVAQLVKNPPAMRVGLGSIPGLGRSPGEGNGYPLQYSGLENSRGCIVHGVAELDMTERLSLWVLTTLY